MGWLNTRDESIQFGGSQIEQVETWKASPQNAVEIILSGGEKMQACIPPGSIKEDSYCPYREDIGIFSKIRFRYSESLKDIEGNSIKGMVCALLADGIWRKCDYRDLVDIAIGIGAIEK